MSFSVSPRARGIQRDARVDAGAVDRRDGRPAADAEELYPAGWRPGLGGATRVSLSVSTCRTQGGRAGRRGASAPVRRHLPQPVR